MKRHITQILCLIIVLSIIPLGTTCAQTGGTVDSVKETYESAVKLLCSASLVDQGRLESVQQLFTQAGVYQFSVEYRLFTEALLIMLTDDVFAYDDAFNTIDRIMKNEKFTVNYQSNTDSMDMRILPDLGDLERYIEARKMESYGDIEGAIAQYDQYPVLDATERAQTLESDHMKKQYNNAIDLLAKDTLSACMEAAAIFKDLGSYRDSQKQLEHCNEQINKLETPTPMPTPTPTPTITPTPTQCTPVLTSTPTPAHVSKIVQIVANASSYATTYILDDTGSLWACGTNHDGQLGDGTVDWSSRPVFCLGGVKSIAAGTGYILAIQEDGTLVSVGNNDSGQLGYSTINGSIDAHLEWGKAMDNVVAVAAGDRHVLAINNQRKLYTWGDNTYHAVDEELSGFSDTPHLYLEDIYRIAAGANSSFAITIDYALYGWGSNTFGQIGIGESNNAITSPEFIMNNFIAVFACKYSSFAIMYGGNLYGWGLNNQGQLGIGSKNNATSPQFVMGNIRTVAIGLTHTLALTENGELYAWGNNDYGQLGIGGTISSLNPKFVMDNVELIAAGEKYSLAVTNDGRLYAWGDNSQGQFGNGNHESNQTPIEIPMP